jgi:PBP1b-binding outer membrane lipoprotein LpoB
MFKKSLFAFVILALLLAGCASRYAEPTMAPS